MVFALGEGSDVDVWRYGQHEYEWHDEKGAEDAEADAGNAGAAEAADY